MSKHPEKHQHQPQRKAESGEIVQSQESDPHYPEFESKPEIVISDPFILRDFISLVIQWYEIFKVDDSNQTAEGGFDHEKYESFKAGHLDHYNLVVFLISNGLGWATIKQVQEEIVWDIISPEKQEKLSKFIREQVAAIFESEGERYHSRREYIEKVQQLMAYLFEGVDYRRVRGFSTGIDGNTSQEPSQTTINHWWNVRMSFNWLSNLRSEHNLRKYSDFEKKLAELKNEAVSKSGIPQLTKTRSDIVYDVITTLFDKNVLGPLEDRNFQEFLIELAEIENDYFKASDVKIELVSRLESYLRSVQLLLWGEFESLFVKSQQLLTNKYGFGAKNEAAAVQAAYEANLATMSALFANAIQNPDAKVVISMTPRVIKQSKVFTEEEYNYEYDFYQKVADYFYQMWLDDDSDSDDPKKVNIVIQPSQNNEKGDLIQYPKDVSKITVPVRMLFEARFLRTVWS